MSLTYETADRMLKGALARAGELGIKVCVVVVDATGNQMCVARMDGASFLSPQIATGKAYTAAAFRRSSADVAKSAESRQVFFDSVAAMTQGKTILTQGGLPIVVDGTVIGAAGASGGTPEQDEDVVRTGIKLGLGLG